jgi:putative transposase
MRSRRGAGGRYCAVKTSERSEYRTFRSLRLRSKFARRMGRRIMSRHARVYTPGVSVHVIGRGNDHTNVFRDEVDRQRFLRHLRWAAHAHGTAVHGFVLMSTHHHLLVTPRDAEALPATMKELGERYVRYFNRKYDRIGTLWSGRYRPKQVMDERYWLTCLRYIEQNPVRAGIVATPESYRWSSYRAHALGETIPWLVDHPAYLALGHDPSQRQLAYRQICGVMLDDQELARQRHPDVGATSLADDGAPSIVLAV